MERLGDLVGPDRRTDALAYELGGNRSRSYSYDSLCTNAWKAGNLMRHYGVREGMTVGVVDGPKDPDEPGPTPIPETVLGLFGGLLNGAAVRFDPPASPDVRVLVAPAAWQDRYELPPGSKYLAFGGPPDDPTVAHFERELWSENPIPMPAEFDPETAALVTEATSFDHPTLLSAAQAVVAEHDLSDGDRVHIDAPLSDPGTVVAGIFAPLVAGGTITTEPDVALVVDEAVAEASRPER